MMLSEPEKSYQPQLIEAKWQKVWREKGLYQAQDPPAGGAKFYCLVEFPYPSGAGLHVGHVRAWAAMDAYVRRKRMQGLNVLYPMGWDAFGLPAENYALKTGVHPSLTVAENVARFKRQCQTLGLSFDWSHEINTTDPSYYRWTQWIFLKMLEKGLAYRAAAPVNWCPSCKTTLADEEVLADGTHERCGQPTGYRMQKQWLLRITAYADRLLRDLKTVDYPPKIRLQQENWIGRSDGVEEFWQVEGWDGKLTTFTTWLHTSWGATFHVIAPEHPVIDGLVKGTRYEEGAKKFIKEVVQEKIKNPFSIEKEKKGYFTGRYAVNHLTGEKMPIYIGNFVLMGYGTGIVKGCPAHDKRDYDFAKKYGLSIRPVISPKKGMAEKDIKLPYVGEGIMINAGLFSGMETKEAKEEITKSVLAAGNGKRAVHYHLRDWVFSRQHYWGEPIPIVYCAKCAIDSKSKVKNQKSKLMTTEINGETYAIVPVPEDQLPVELPYVEKYEPSGTGESPLAKIEDWVNVLCPVCGGPARRETDTMPNWAGSNWYYLAYLLANRFENQNLNVKGQNDEQEKGQNIFSQNKDLIDAWMPVDIYEGGFEHTTLHLLYSRFIYKFLYDLGVVPGPEPYARRRSHGIVLGPDGRKMSKSFGNVVNPEDIVTEYGADTLRLYEMFMGSFDQMVSWSADSLAGCRRFLARVFRLFQERVGEESASPELTARLHKTVKKVGEDLEALKFNTAVSALMEFINAWEGGLLAAADVKTFLKILAPFAPHLAEELWQRLTCLAGRQVTNYQLPTTNQHVWSVHQQPWPAYDPRLIQEKMTTVVVQVNGKLRERLRVNSGAGETEVRALAEKSQRLAVYLRGYIKRTVFVPDKLLNFVIDPKET